jgi:hypothetical protein
MKPNLPPLTTGSRAFRLLKLTTTASLLLCGMLLRAAVPADPIIELRFPEGPSGTGGNGVITTNTGTLSGYMTFAQDTSNPFETNTLPVFTNLVPVGTYVPTGNDYSVNMGTVSGACAGGSGSRAIDSSPSFSTIGACDKLTLCGWVNANSLPGARSVTLAYAFESAGVSGFHLEENLNGTLDLSVNGYENEAPSSTLILTPSSSYATNNWVFFAVTYDPTLSADQLKYYFGRPNKLAAIDVAATYVPASSLGSNVDYTGPLSFGNASTSDGIRNETGSCSRIFRGLMDELKIYTNALTIDEIQQAQLNATVPSTPVTFLKQPANVTAPVGANATFTCEANGSGQVTYQWRTNGVAVPGATNTSFTLTNVPLPYSVTNVSVLADNAATTDPGLLSTIVTLTVIPADPMIVSLSFSANSGILSLNNGAFGGVVRRKVVGTTPEDYPQWISTNVPSGSNAPSAAYNVESLNMGVIPLSQRAVDMTNNIVSTVGNLSSMKALTICGWLNSANQTFRTTSTGRGCGIVNASLGDNKGGFALAYRNNSLGTGPYGENGRLALYVNDWPNGDPAASQLSSINTIPLNTNLPPENWVFFAVTYDGTSSANNLNYYFGNSTNAAVLDPICPLTYNKGVIAATGPLSIGNHNCVPGDPNTVMPGNPTGRAGGNPPDAVNNAQWRGLIDEIKIYNKVLSPNEILAAQRSPSLPPHLLYTNRTSTLGLSWEGPFQLQSRTNLDAGNWSNVTASPSVSGTIRSLDVPYSGSSRFYRLLY